MAGREKLFRFHGSVYFGIHAALIPHAAQEELDGGLSSPLQKLWIACDAEEGEARGVPEQKIEEQVGRELGVVYLDLAASGKLLKQNCHAPDSTQPTILMCELCQCWELNRLRRQNSLQGGALRHRRLGNHVPAKLMQGRLDILGVAFSGLGLGRRR